MVDEYTEYSPSSGSAGWSGPFFGVILLVVSVCLLFWNEGRSLDRAIIIKQCREKCVSVSPTQVSPANNWKLLYMNGKATTPEVLSDQLMGVSANAIRLHRKASMYQWKEETEENGDYKKYRYSRVWAEELIDSSEFRKPDGHQNPSQMPIQSADETASNVTLGVFTLSPDLVTSMNHYKPLPLPTNALSGVSPDVKDQMQVHGSEFYWGQNPMSPQIGDERISYAAVIPGTVSVIAMQSENGLVTYTTYSGKTFQMIKSGSIPPAAMFDIADNENRLLTWMLRLAGFILSTISVALFFGPLTWLANWIPIIGDIVDMATSLVSAVVGAAISLITISVAWLYYRPVIGASMIIAAFALLVYLGTHAKQRKAVPARS